MVEGVETNLPLLRWLVDHPVLRDGPVSTAFLVDHPPLTTPPRKRARGAWASPWRLNLPPPAPAPPPDPDGPAGEPAVHAESAVVSPMPGTVLAVAVAAGDAVEARATLVVLEAMKLEHVVTAPFAGTVVEVDVVPGDVVAAGSRLVELET